MVKIPEGYTRISDISSAYAGYSKIPKEFLDNAASRGTLVHNIIRDILRDIPVDESEWDHDGKSVKGYVDSFRRFWNHDWNILAIEQRYNESDLKISGEMDLLAEIDGKVTLIDWKCTAKTGKHWKIQGSGYTAICEKPHFILHDDNTEEWCNPIHIDRVWFVRLESIGISPDIVEIEPNIDLFLSAFELYQEFFKNQKINIEKD